MLNRIDVSTSVRIVQEFGIVEHEAKSWDLIAEEANSPMHQYAWVKACTDAFVSGGELHLIVVGNDQPSALGPLIMRGRPLNRMECLGVDELYEPTDFPHLDRESLASLVNALIKLRRPLLLRRIPDGRAELGAIRYLVSGRGRLLSGRAARRPLSVAGQKSVRGLFTSRLTRLRTTALPTFLVTV